MIKFKLLFAMLLLSFPLASCGAAVLQPTGSYTRIVSVDVDYSADTREMLNPYGQVDTLIETDIPEDNIQTPSFRSIDRDVSLPSDRQTLRSMVLLHVNWSGEAVYHEYAIYEMERLGMRPATALETLFFLEHSRYVLESANVVALGSYWTNARGGRMVMVAGKRSGDKFLRLRHVGEGFPSHCLFLAVPVRG